MRHPAISPFPPPDWKTLISPLNALNMAGRERLIAMKLHSLHPSAREREAAQDAQQQRFADAHEPDGMEISVSHEHMQKMGMDKPPASGSEVHLHGRGHVVESRSEDVGGETRHHMRIRLTHAGVEHDDDEGDKPRAGLRGELEKQVADGGRVKMAARR